MKHVHIFKGPLQITVYFKHGMAVEHLLIWFLWAHEQNI